jgi:preprotein translocase subunit SecG
MELVFGLAIIFIVLILISTSQSNGVDGEFGDDGGGDGGGD